jgi:hypothetical protein
MELVECLLETAAKSVKAMRRHVNNVRYGKSGVILFDFDSVTYETPEPKDVMPVGYGDASLRWALRQYLDNNVKLHQK